jgi:hypothetical protein
MLSGRTERLDDHAAARRFIRCIARAGRSVASIDDGRAANDYPTARLSPKFIVREQHNLEWRPLAIGLLRRGRLVGSAF